MPRIEGIDPEKAAPSVRARMEQNIKRFGYVLPGTGVSGHAPTIQEGTSALDAGIGAAGRIPRVLRTMLNLRVASIVGCPF
jgi:hypothetical protein